MPKATAAAVQPVRRRISGKTPPPKGLNAAGESPPELIEATPPAAARKRPAPRRLQLADAGEPLAKAVKGTPACEDVPSDSHGAPGLPAEPPVAAEVDVLAEASAAHGGESAHPRGPGGDVVLASVQRLVSRGAGQAELAAAVRGLLGAGRGAAPASAGGNLQLATRSEGHAPAPNRFTSGIDDVEAALGNLHVQQEQTRAALEVFVSEKVGRVEETLQELKQRRDSVSGVLGALQHREGSSSSGAQAASGGQGYVSGLDSVEASLLALQRQQEETRAALASFVEGKIGRVQDTLSELQRRKAAVSGVLDALQRLA